MITTQGTDIKQAIDLAMKSFTPNQDVSKAIFVITDGEDNEGGAVEMAKAAAEKGIKVYVLGVGSPQRRTHTHARKFAVYHRQFWGM